MNRLDVLDDRAIRVLRYVAGMSASARGAATRNTIIRATSMQTALPRSASEALATLFKLRRLGLVKRNASGGWIATREGRRTLKLGETRRLRAS